MKLELKIVLTFGFMAFTALSFHMVNTEIVVEQEHIARITGPKGHNLDFRFVAN